ncbi:MAG: hypothetical protein U1C71_03495 [archaeon]|nr:hypothetical protein [archaeon]
MGFFDNFRDTWGLLKHTFLLMGKNKAILAPTLMFSLWAALINILFIVLLVGWVYLAFFGDPASVGGEWKGTILTFFWLGILLIIMLNRFLIVFLRTYYRAAQSWIVYKTFAGQKSTFHDGINRARQNWSDILSIGILEILADMMAKQLKRGTGGQGIFVILINIVLHLIGRIVEEGWDLIGHYILPAAIIEDKTLGQVLPDIKHIKENVPGALVGVFGIDFVGDLVRGSFTLVFFLGLFVSIIISIMTWNPLPFLIMLLLMIIVSFILSRLIELVKNVYFTLFYITIMRPMDISNEYRGDVMNYLAFQGGGAKTGGMSFVSGKTTPFPKGNTSNPTTLSSAKSPPMKVAQPTPVALSPEEQAERVMQLIPHVQRYRRQGYSDADIRTFLSQGGWPLVVINVALRQAGD